MDNLMRIKISIEKARMISPEEYIICPFGKNGKKTKNVLNEDFGIKEKYVFDLNIFPEMKVDVLDEDHKKVVLIAAEDRAIQNFYIGLFETVRNCVLINIFENYDFVTNAYSEIMSIKHGFDFDTLIYRMKTRDVSFYLPFYNNDIIQKYIVTYDQFKNEDQLYWVTRVFDNGIVGKRLENTGLVLDIGSNIGNHSIYFATQCNAERIMAFEPIKQTYEILCKNIEINKLSNTIQAMNVAVGDEDSIGIIDGIYDISNTGGTKIRKNIEYLGDDSDTFPVVAIDRLLSQDDRVDLMKIDVEGFEYNVISGAINTIKHSHPYIMIESWDEDNNILHIIETMISLGYKWIQFSSCDYLFYYSN